MRLHALIMGTLIAGACGGKSKPPKAEPPPPPEELLETEPEPAPEPPPPPPPKQWHASVALTPVKGAKVKPATIAYSQTEGEEVKVTTETPLEGLKPGKYHLVVHEAAACGPNATKAGAAWPNALDVEIVKGTPGVVDQAQADVALDGESSLIGHTLVLHEDKKGRPGKALACGPIASVETESAGADE